MNNKIAVANRWGEQIAKIFCAHIANAIRILLFFYIRTHLCADQIKNSRKKINIFYFSSVIHGWNNTTSKCSVNNVHYVNSIFKSKKKCATFWKKGINSIFRIEIWQPFLFTKINVYIQMHKSTENISFGKGYIWI